LVKKLGLSFAILLAAAWVPGVALADKPFDKPVQRVEPAFDALVSPDAKMELIKDGYGFTEGVVWSEKGRYLLVTDMPANIIYKLSTDGKQQSVYLDHSGYTKPDIWRVGFMQTNGRLKDDPKFEEFAMIGSNGMAFDRQGRLVIATWSGRSIDRIEPNGKRTVLTGSVDGKQFNGTNDLIVKKNGTIYFTDGYGGLRGRENDPKKGIDYSALFMWKNGKTSRLTTDLPNTNGLALSPDEKILYANGSRDKTVRAYDVQADDTLTNSRMFFDLSKDARPGITDGMKVDTKGNVWESGPTGVWVISPEGKHLGTILVPELVANVEFGDPDHKTLYIAARSSVYKIRVNVAGIP
jgi:gluconolactonase